MGIEVRVNGVDVEVYDIGAAIFILVENLVDAVVEIIVGIHEKNVSSLGFGETLVPGGSSSAILLIDELYFGESLFYFFKGF
jgi:hypothetical protein